MSGNEVSDMAGSGVVVNLCPACGFMVTDGKCPNAMNHFVAELPPLGVCITDTAGVAGKVGG